MPPVVQTRIDLRRRLAWALAFGLSIATAVAIGALLTGSLDDTDARVIGTSLGFSVFSATGAAGARVARATDPRLRVLGHGTAAASVLSFLLLVGWVWGEAATEHSLETLIRVWGCAALLALAGSHASLVLGARRPLDGALIDLLVLVSVGGVTLDTAIGLLAVTEVIEDVDEQAARWVAAAGIVSLLATVLQPILRRAASPPANVGQDEWEQPLAQEAPSPGSWWGDQGRTRSDLPEANRSHPLGQASQTSEQAGFAASGLSMRGLSSAVRPLGVPALVVAAIALMWLAGERHRSNCLEAGRTNCSVLPWVQGDERPKPVPVSADAPYARGADPDTRAQYLARGAAAEVEYCARADEVAGYTRCEEADGVLVQTGLDASRLEVTAASAKEYVVSATSDSGNTFTIAKGRNGARKRLCTSPGNGGCRPGDGGTGTW